MNIVSQRALLGVCLLCVLLASATGAQSAAALGTTAYTCKEVSTPGPQGTKGFKDEHCKEASENIAGQLSNVKFEHEAFPVNKATEVAGTNGTTGGSTEPFFLHSVQSGVEEELKATGVSAIGIVENKEEGGEMFIHGKAVTTYTGVTVVKPAGKGCQVKGEQIVTNELTASTKGQGDAAKITPASGEVFTSFDIEGCSIGVLNGLYEVKGSIATSSIEGATAKYDRTSTTLQSTLKIRGQKLGLSGSTTWKGRSLSTDPYRPLVQTT